MKRIGILGGMTAESTASYYLHITRRYQQLRGDHGYPEMVVFSVSFQAFEDWMEAGNWDAIEHALAGGLDRLAEAGADFAVIATNTMHLLFERLRARSPLPLISIVEATARAIEACGLRTVGLLGTRFTMEKPFYAEGLAASGITTLVPEKPDRELIHRVIMQELAAGTLRDESRRQFVRIVDGLASRGAEGIVLGCTEIPLLLTAKDTRLPLFDTATLHADAALDMALR